MKWTAPREVMLQPLSRVIGVVERRQTLPILANVLVSLDGNDLRLTATDLEVELSASVEVEVETEGTITLPARKFMDICRALPDGADVEVQVDGEKATLRSGRSRFTLATLPANDFPRLEGIETPSHAKLSCGALAEALERVSFAMAQQDVRYYLNGMLIELHPGEMRSVATDGHRLAISEAEAESGVSEDAELIVPRKGVIELQRLLSDEEDDAEIRFGTQHLRVDFARTRFLSKLIDHKFPDYNAVIPRDAEYVVIADRRLLRESLLRAAILSNEKFRGVRLEFEPSRLRVIAHNPEQEEAVEEIEVDTEMHDFAVGFNVNYLLDALGALSGETVELRFKDPNSSVLLSSVDSDEARHVVMPLRL